MKIFFVPQIMYESEKATKEMGEKTFTNHISNMLFNLRHIENSHNSLIRDKIAIKNSSNFNE